MVLVRYRTFTQCEFSNRICWGVVLGWEDFETVCCLVLGWLWVKKYMCSNLVLIYVFGTFFYLYIISSAIRVTIVGPLRSLVSMYIVTVGLHHVNPYSIIGGWVMLWLEGKYPLVGDAVNVK